MSIDALRLTAQILANDQQTVGIMFFILREQNAFVARKVELSRDAQLALTAELKLELQEFFETDYVLRDLTAIDLRQDAIFRYNLPNYPSQLEVLKSTLDAPDTIADFNHANDSVTNLKAIVVLLGNGNKSLAVYKHHYPTNTYRRNGFSLLRAGIAQDRFEKLDQDIIRMGHTIDFIYNGTDVFVTTFKVLEKFFGFKEAVKADATVKLATLTARNIVQDAAVLEERITVQGDLTFARKVIRAIAHSRVLDTVPNDQIIQFIKQHQSLSKKIKVNAADTQIILDTKVSQNFFMKLLNDDYLKSELTKFEYDADSKDLVEP
ncbi:anti-phage protein KwaB [Pseudomonas shirazica]|uniref:anti-phage protein KwaB n=1 Tax=Pseudomonas shirazica TaxID=1940636 RepID=UPI0025A9AC90|nr:anti-phage protein KwaB [Pseudomonas shirazica]MDM9599761.1 anti-phage protein KwaB [Pseudomonas shirazica]MDO2413189.1 anti-phage protein KwaB [Pseudomonas shirazica]